MSRRQTRIPRKWLVADHRNAHELRQIIRRVPRQSGILFLLRDLPATERARLLRGTRRLAFARDLIFIDEAAGGAARVHNLRELRHALLQRTPIVLLSPMFATRSHPDWQALPRMRAAAFARIADRRLIALGGVDERRFSKIAPLGFQAWAAIDAFRT